MSLILTCDLGGSSVRAALVDRAGNAVALQRRPAPEIQSDAVGHSEVAPESWWNVFMGLVEALAAETGKAFDTIEAVAVCGLTRTQILLDVAGRPLRPAIAWGDTRAETLGPALQARLPEHPERARINAFHPLARLAWLREHEPNIAAAIATVLEPKDYLNYRLTGRAATDPISSARLLAAAQPGAQGDLLAAAGLARSILPDCLSPTDVVGTITQQSGALARLAGRPVFCLSHDTWGAVLGLGALRPGYAYNISGTTEVIGVISDHPLAAEGLMAVEWGRDLHQLGGPSQNGADTLTWLREIVAREAELFDSPRHPQPVLFLPYLQGERVPYWDAALRGAALGLTRRHGAVDLAWAVMEGVAFQNRLVLERAEASLGASVRELRLGGGAANNARWCQIKADVCGRPVVVGEAAEPGLLGAAIAARVGLGQFASLAAGQDAMVRIARRYAPRAAVRETYDRLYALYRRAEAAVAPLSHELSAVAGSLPGVGRDL